MHICSKIYATYYNKFAVGTCNSRKERKQDKKKMWKMVSSVYYRDIHFFSFKNGSLSESYKTKPSHLKNIKQSTIKCDLSVAL